VSQLARVRFDAEGTDFLVVLDAEREVLTNRDPLVQAQRDTATPLVSVYRALRRGCNAPGTVTAKAGTPTRKRLSCPIFESNRLLAQIERAQPAIKPIAKLLRGSCDQLVQAQSDTATALVAVYRALGGGWNAPAAVTAKAATP
jgi:outer membrane protein TolC